MTTCEVCGDELSEHIGGKPCTGGAPGTQETYSERRARIVAEQERKRAHRLFGHDEDGTCCEAAQAWADLSAT